MGNGARLDIDPERFRLLVLALAAAGCRAPGRNDPPPVVAPIDIPPVSATPAREPEPLATPEPGASASATPRAPDEGAPAPSACERQNDADVVDCSLLKKRPLRGPACEGVTGNCDLLARGYAYRSRPGRVAVECMARLGDRVCNMGAKKKCYEEGIRAACPDPQYEAACEAKMDACRAAHVRVEYTKEECVKVMSSLTGGDQSWALSAMGPSSEGKCRLMFTVF